jgi:hypothetical protein
MPDPNEHLAPDVRAKVDQILAGDGDTLTAPDIASCATWADKFRDSDRHTSQRRHRLPALPRQECSRVVSLPHLICSPTGSPRGLQMGSLSSPTRGEPKRGDGLQAFMAASSSDQLNRGQNDRVQLFAARRRPSLLNNVSR